MSTNFYSILFCSTGQILVLICLDQKIDAITFDLRDDFNPRLKDFLNQLIQDSEPMHTVTYGLEYYLN